MIEIICKAVEGFTRRKKQADDLTVIIVKKK
jgi:serine phosphatase RsbU (regulator of sigma subunit)